MICSRCSASQWRCWAEKIDFVLHSIGMSPNVRKRRTYDDLDYVMLNKTLDVSAISFHKMLQVAKKNWMLLPSTARWWR